MHRWNEINTCLFFGLFFSNKHVALQCSMFGFMMVNIRTRFDRIKFEPCFFFFLSSLHQNDNILYNKFQIDHSKLIDCFLFIDVNNKSRFRFQNNFETILIDGFLPPKNTIDLLFVQKRFRYRNLYFTKIEDNIISSWLN